MAEPYIESNSKEFPSSSDYQPPASAEYQLPASADRPPSNTSTTASRPTRARGSVLALAGKLQDRSIPWNERDEALQKLAHLFTTGQPSPHLEDFVTQLKAAVHGLVAQLQDLRSQVVRSACVAVAQLVALVGDHPAFERLLREHLLPGLLQLASNGNKVLAGNGRECLPALVMHCHFDGVLKVLAAYLKESRHVVVRHSCCVCLLHALQYWPLPTLTTVGALLERVLVPATADAAVEVRALARQCLVQYEIAFPQRAAPVEETLDSPTKRLIRQEVRSCSSHVSRVAVV